MFDGVHLGHQAILKHVVRAARQLNAQSVVFSFNPHPRQVLGGEPVELLTSVDEKAELLQALEVDHFVVQPFTRHFSLTTAQEYVRDILVKQFHVAKLVIGYDHHFGKNREGSLENLKKMAPNYGFEVIEIPALDIDAVNVSSTKIRKALLSGNVDIANQYLGYPYSLTGTVVRGDQLGRTLGFPTANVDLQEPLKLVPRLGVYAAVVSVNGQTFPAMVNIGWRPTVNALENDKRIEAHLFNFEGDLYGARLTLKLYAYIRPEERFGNLEALKDQLGKDREVALKLTAQLT